MTLINANDIGKALTVGEVAERSGVAVSALHFYETKGLIQSWRSSGNQRRYHRDVPVSYTHLTLPTSDLV